MTSGPGSVRERQSEAALARYAARMKRPRIWYFSIVAAIVVVFGVFAAVIWNNGEAAHVTLHTASRAAPSVGLAQPTATQKSLWHTGDRAALGYPVRGGTVVTYSTHTVVGRDVGTGKVDWSYNRSDRRTCTAVQLEGITMAIYATGPGDCDEISAFDTGTGKRAWTRTLDEDAQPLNGRPAYAWTPFTLMMTTSSVIYAIDPASGLDRWTYSRYGCDIHKAVIGTAGALISQTCVHPHCPSSNDQCKSGVQLMLRDPSAGKLDDSKPKADQIIWNDAGNSDVPLSADSVISAVNTTTRLADRYSTSSGKPQGTITLSPAPATLAASQPSTAVDTDQAQLAWIAGHLYAFPASGNALWSRAASSPPTLDIGADGDLPSLGTVRISVPDGSGIAIIDGNTGRTERTLRLSSPLRSGALVYAVGTGYVAADSSGTTVFE